MSNTPPPPPSFNPGGDVATAASVNPAPPLVRLAGFAIGTLLAGAVVAICFGIISLIVGGAASGDEVSFEEFVGFLGRFAVGSAIALIPAILTLRWTRNLWRKSTSPGKSFVKLRVVDARTGAPASMGQMIRREIVGKYGILLVPAAIFSSGSDGNTNDTLIFALMGAHVLVGIVLMLRTPKRQATWDYIAKTTVVKAD